MARLAVCTQRSFVFVVRLVASDACRGCVLKVGRLRMASLALGVCMLSIQLETSSSVIETRIRPFALRVAVAALGSKRALMLVTGFVARETQCRQLYSCRRRNMTTLTLDRTVFTSKRVLGVGVVIEIGFPVAYAVTGLAAVTQCATVFIVLAMAPNAGGWHAFVLASHVTGRALHLDVTTQKLKFCFLVVIEADVRPFAYAMACLALRA